MQTWLKPTVAASPFLLCTDLASKAELKGLLCLSEVLLSLAGRQAGICVTFEGPWSLSPFRERLPGDTHTKPLPHSADFCVKENNQREPGRKQEESQLFTRTVRAEKPDVGPSLKQGQPAA